jgi:hypothetical protein
MKCLSILFVLFALSSRAQNLSTPFEKSGGKRTATYKQLTSFYEKLDVAYKTICLGNAGPTDAAYPLHVVYYSSDKKFDIERWKENDKFIILINNGIHPGEPDGIDACMLLLRDAAEGRIEIPGNIVLAVIPVFNVGGMLNRGSYSRANQNGPEAYGFRGNAQNLDLNRDFMKLNAKETRSLVRLFHLLDPDVFIDNHVSNGADYQHVMTLLATQHNKLGGSMGKYLEDEFEPAIVADMSKKGEDVIPYVHDFKTTPVNGWQGFYDPARFASGFASLFQTYAFVPETHMLKPFKQRVEATYSLMRTIIAVAYDNAEDIKHTRKEDRKKLLTQNTFALDWQIDTNRYKRINFKGYEAYYKKSEVSGLQRLYYDRKRPFTRTVPYYNTFNYKQVVTAPHAYVIPHGWKRVVNRMRDNGVQIQKLDKDTVMQVTAYYIKDYETGKRPYEGHYLHTNVKVVAEKRSVKLLKGDYLIPVNQQAKRYIIEALEPTAPDAFLAWGFFDAILQQKEYFSDYVFEDVAAELLKNDADLRSRLTEKQKTDSTFAASAATQLDFIYRNSPYYEPGHMRYPVFRIE